MCEGGGGGRGRGRGKDGRVQEQTSAVQVKYRSTEINLIKAAPCEIMVKSDRLQ